MRARLAVSSRGGSSTRCWPRPARRGRCLSGGCWTLCRSMTRWRPRTPPERAIVLHQNRRRGARGARRLRLRAPRRTATGTTPSTGTGPSRGGRGRGARRARGELDGALSEAAELLAAVAGQDLCQDSGGRFMIARRVATGPVVTPATATRAPRFDGYKGHTAVDPDSELTAAVTPANTADAQPAPELINDIDTGGLCWHRRHRRGLRHRRGRGRRHRRGRRGLWHRHADIEDADSGTADTAEGGGVVEEFAGRPTVYGDSRQRRSGAVSRAASTRGAAPSICGRAGGRFTKDRFKVVLSGTVRRPASDGSRPATGARCAATAPAPPGAGIGANDSSRDYRAVRIERKLGTSCATAADARVRAGPKSTPTSTCWPQPPTSRASACSDCTRHHSDGPSAEPLSARPPPNPDPA